MNSVTALDVAERELSIRFRQLARRQANYRARGVGHLTESIGSDLTEITEALETLHALRELIAERSTFESDSLDAAVSDYTGRTPDGTEGTYELSRSDYA